MISIEILISSLFSNIFYSSHIKGKGKIVTTPDVFLKFNKSSILNLKGNLILGDKSFGRNKRSTILRMDEGSELYTEGNFSIYYGGDIILFKGAKLFLGKGSFINNNAKIRCYESITIGSDCAISHR